MINFEATSPVSAEDKTNGLELVLTRVQGEPDGITASFDYDLNSYAARTNLYFGGRILYPDGRAGSKKINIIDIDSANMKNMLVFKKEIYNNDQDYLFLKKIADGMTKTFQLSHSTKDNTICIVCVDNKTLAYMNMDPTGNESLLENGEIILAEIRVNTK